MNLIGRNYLNISFTNIKVIFYSISNYKIIVVCDVNLKLNLIQLKGDVRECRNREYL